MAAVEEAIVEVDRSSVLVSWEELKVMIVMVDVTTKIARLGNETKLRGRITRVVRWDFRRYRLGC